MALYDGVSGLPLVVDSLRLERRSLVVASGWERVTTTVILAGGGHEGRGEDITYEPEWHVALAAAPAPPVIGSGTFADLSSRLAGVSADFTRWAFESAGLDLALRQAGLSLGAAIGRTYAPVRFALSTREDARTWLAAHPGMEFKLDVAEDWSDEYYAALAAAGAVRVLDLKAYYQEEVVGPSGERHYRACVERFGADTVIEDPSLDASLWHVLEPASDRLSFDAPIHRVSHIEELPFRPRHMNIKPSRFGTVSELFAAIDHCDANGIAMYGGGQFELGIGRRQVQEVASLCYADAPNDVAPSVYHDAKPGDPDLPMSPLPAPPGLPGFGA